MRHQRSIRDWVAAHRAPASPMAPLTESAPPAARPANRALPALLAPDAPMPDSPAELVGQLEAARWQIEALHTLLEYAERTYGIEIRKKTGAKQSR